MTSIEARALKWAIGGDTGSSSKALCAHMSGNEPEDRFRDYPSDPADLGRCLRLLGAIPEWKPRIPEMAAYGTGWAGLVKRWDEIAFSMAEEVGIHWERGREAPKTYRMMELAIADGYRNDENYSCIFAPEGHLRYAERVKPKRPRSAASNGDRGSAA